MREIIWEEETGTGELVVERREGCEGKEEIARLKAEAIEELYANLETSEGQKDIYRIAAARDRAGKDIDQMRTIKSAMGDVLMRDEDIRERWGSVLQLADE